MAVPAELHWLFWELDPARIDLAADSGYVMARVLEHGGLAEVRWLLARYGREAIHAFLRDVGHSELSDRTIAFWRAAFAAKDETWASPPAWRKSSSVPWSV
jgi:hypothetical protein